MSDPEITIHDLIEDCQLDAVSFIEISAKQRFEKLSSSEVQQTEASIDPVHSLQLARSEDDGGFRIRVRTEIDTEPGLIVVDAAAEYSLAARPSSDYSAELLVEFANKVAVFALIPYIRQAIADVTQRVFGTSLLMPMIRRGELEFIPVEESPAPQGEKAVLEE